MDKEKLRSIRTTAGYSQKELANFFDIPVGTLRNWEQGIASPPDYVFNLICNNIRRNKMINIETLKFQNMLNNLAELAENGIEEFDLANIENFRTKVFYDNKKSINGEYRIVCDACLYEDHHDIVAYYDSDTNEYSIRAVFDEEYNIPYIVVRMELCDDEIVIENGKWYFA